MMILRRLNGLAEGVSSLIHSVVRQEWSSFTSLSSTAQFEPRGRNTFGVRLMWNKGKPLSMDKKWNPFARNIPWMTFTSHPLFWHKGSDSDKMKYDVHALHLALQDLLSASCEKLENPIIIENYVGIGSLVHNRTGLGFFKIRGKNYFLVFNIETKTMSLEGKNVKKLLLAYAFYHVLKVVAAILFYYVWAFVKENFNIFS